MNGFFSRVRSVSPALACGLSAFLLGVHDAYCQDALSGGFTTASDSFKRYVRQGISIAALICTVVALGTAGWKFMNKDPGAVWYLVGVVAGGVVFGVAQGILSSN